MLVLFFNKEMLINNLLLMHSLFLTNLGSHLGVLLFIMRLLPEDNTPHKSLPKQVIFLPSIIIKKSLLIEKLVYDIFCKFLNEIKVIRIDPMNILSYEVFSQDLRKVIGDKMKEIFLVGLE